MEKLDKKIMGSQFSYNEISEFFEKKEEEKILIFKERFGLLFFINYKDSEEIGNKYDDSFLAKKDDINNLTENYIERFFEMKKKINQLELIINDFNIFYPISQKSLAENINILISKYKNKKDFDAPVKKISQYIDEYYKVAEKRNKIKDSFLFKSIYEQEKKNFDETKAIINAQDKFEEMKKILNKNLSDEKLLRFCLEKKKKKTKDEIFEESHKSDKSFY